MRDRPDVPFAFLHDLLDRADEFEAPSTGRAPDEALVGSKAAVLDATANVLAAMRQLLQATEDMVRMRRQRIVEPPAPPPAPRQEHTGRERLDITY